MSSPTASTATTSYTTLDSPLGELLLVGEESSTAPGGTALTSLSALGAAIAANPLPIVRPCHRVIGADGSMRGYAAGAERKTALLTHEGALQPTLI